MRERYGWLGVDMGLEAESGGWECMLERGGFAEVEIEMEMEGGRMTRCGERSQDGYMEIGGDGDGGKGYWVVGKMGDSEAAERESVSHGIKDNVPLGCREMLFACSVCGLFLCRNTYPSSPILKEHCLHALCYPT